MPLFLDSAPIFLDSATPSYASTWGAVASWVVPSEIFPIRIRGLAVGLATMGNWLANVVVAFVTPILIRPDVADVSGTFITYAAFMAIAIPVVACMLPETKGSSLEEIEDKFAKPLPLHIADNLKELMPTGEGGEGEGGGGGGGGMARRRKGGRNDPAGCKEIAL